MPSRWITPIVLGLAGLSAASPVGLAGQQAPPNQPGMPTLARVQVINQGVADAVPVVLQAGGDVQPVAVISAPALSLAPNAAVGTRDLGQRWEYRFVTARTSDDLTATLNRIGDEGWEAVGMTGAPPPAGGWQVLAKRPRP